MGGSGKVVYWESIASAATFVFMKKDRTGVEYTISGMQTGEKVVAITNAESAGFILTFNSGRLAYMNAALPFLCNFSAAACRPLQVVSLAAFDMLFNICLSKEMLQLSARTDPPEQARETLWPSPAKADCMHGESTAEGITR
ncbi:hypothetical protein LB505_013202 [Fusarium chuoi]|nr:hypothetical protein LB505_013202 [Fusarium chuoi]